MTSSKVEPVRKSVVVNAGIERASALFVDRFDAIKPTAARAYLGQGTEEVTRDELLDRIKTEQITVIDVRPRKEYDAGHIPSAVSAPLDELADHLAELPADHAIVAYCRGAYCVLAHEGVRLLIDQGYTAVRLSDGMLEWRLADLPVAMSCQ